VKHNIYILLHECSATVQLLHSSAITVQNDIRDISAIKVRKCVLAAELSLENSPTERVCVLLCFHWEKMTIEQGWEEHVTGRTGAARAPHILVRDTDNCLNGASAVN